LDEAIQTPAPVILLDADGHQAWENALRTAVEMRPTARVVVLARQADERMWVGVRSLGAHDLLPKPFHSTEVRSVVLGAFQGKSQVIWKGPLHLVLHAPGMGSPPAPAPGKRMI
jgi:FixJ family two-component response regulator